LTQTKPKIGLKEKKAHHIAIIITINTTLIFAIMRLTLIKADAFISIPSFTRVSLIMAKIHIIIGLKMTEKLLTLI
jgi:hypothetical protein